MFVSGEGIIIAQIKASPMAQKNKIKAKIVGFYRLWKDSRKRLWERRDTPQITEVPFYDENGVLWNSIDGNKWDGLVDRNLVASKFGIVKPGAPMPYEQPEAPKTRKMPKISEIVALKGDSNKGKNIAVRCIMCHKIEGNGVLFGPSLNGWAKGRSSQEILNAIINPDADIAHGFTSSRVKLKNGKVIDGLIKSGAERARHFVASGGAEPHMVIKTAGGTTQKISWRHIKEVQKLERSLMFYPESLGLTQAQDFVDLAEYLKTLK